MVNRQATTFDFFLTSGESAFLFFEKVSLDTSVDYSNDLKGERIETYRIYSIKRLPHRRAKILKSAALE